MVKLFEGLDIFKLQWHITAKCQMKCKHCYLYEDETYKKEISNELDFKTCINIMDDFVEFCNHLKIRPFISFTGGDPLLREDFFDLLYEAHDRGIEIEILGNSFCVNDEIAFKLKSLGVNSYQLSLDGMKEIHDSLRVAGSFDDTIRAIKVLKNANIKTIISMTLSKQNAQDILKLMARIGINIFTTLKIVAKILTLKKKKL